MLGSGGEAPYLTPRLFDDALTPHEKLGVVLKSAWGQLLLTLDLIWLAGSVIFWN